MKRTISMLFIFTLLIGSTVLFAQSDRTESSRTVNQNDLPAEGPNFHAKIDGQPSVQNSLYIQHKQAVESGDVTTAKRLEQEINSISGSAPAVNVDGITVSRGSNAPFTPDWNVADVQVYAGNIAFSGHRQIDMKLGEDGSVYMAVNRAAVAGTFGRIDIYRSSNSGATWTNVALVSSATGYIGQLSLQVEKRSATLDDSTRIFVYFSYASVSTMDNATLYYASWRRDGLMSYVGQVAAPAAGNKLTFPSAMSDGAFYSTATYIGVAYSEQSNTTSAGISVRFSRSIDWGINWVSQSYGATYDDRFPSAAFKRGTGGASDSVYIAVERHFSATNYLVRVIAVPWTPAAGNYTYYVPPIAANILYEKPVIAIRQKTNADSCIIAVLKDGIPYYHNSPIAGTWNVDYALGSFRSNFVWMASTVNAGVGAFEGLWETYSGDSIGIRRGVIGNLGSTLSKRNSTSSSPSVSPVSCIFESGSTFFSMFGYAGFGPLNIYANQENLPTNINPISGIPNTFSLAQNYPNPFNPVTSINFSIPKSEFVKLIVFDALGREVATLVNGETLAGSYKVDFNAANLSTGAYFYKLTTGSFSDIKKMMLIK